MVKQGNKLSAKKLVAGFLAAVMVAGLVGCSSNNENTSAASDTSDFNKEGMPIVNEQVTLKVLTVRWGSMGDTFTQNQWLKDLEGKTNIKIEWEVMSSNDWGEQKSIMLASGTLPDVVLGNQSFSDSDIVNNLSYFRPIDDYIDQYMPNLKAAMEETPDMRKISTFPDGKVYSMPTRLPSRPQSSRQPVINKTWLDNLGLEVPETIDDLYNVLKAFKEQDPNGNGKPDEIPYIEINNDTISPFGIADLNNNFMLVKDGQPVYYPTSEEYKEGLKWENKLYAEGLLDKELFTQDDTMRSAKFQNPDAPIVGFTYQWTPDAVFGKWSDQYVTIPPIAGPDGNRYTIGNPIGMNLSRNELLITTSSKYPEVAARWADEFYTNEASIQNFWGAIGTVIQKNDDGTYSLMDPPTGTSADAWYWDQSLRDFGPKYVSPSFEEKIILSEKSGDGLKLQLDKLGSEFVTTPFPNVMYTAEEFEELPTLTTDIDGYVNTMRAQFISKGNIDEQWDAYVKQLNDMGLEKLIKIRTDAYGRYMKVE
ncbi:extracellular solute-binding protein [Paenibacillus crassostreae]|uniref:ABC transporter substrate-binding protein n=1 Tax=Paenibacillus crassostreae TaxID=1763538 RepID=A0A167F964_9BACL|nr:extracellular solute-binding protein [Paenibacillus crassostreae]AOZ90913.1 ABC transporter substrate-binding protein [Paenibacillus crassostreae]OAB76320.1 ABC transporter substrate-binding protein [Paenibacillus crassostreae]